MIMDLGVNKAKMLINNDKEFESIMRSAYNQLN